jgi:beta-apo-4'-carotenal oxygenase
LAGWVKDEKAPDIPLVNFLLNPRISKESLGTVLVINVPVQLALDPSIGAIAASCTAILKPFEIAPATAIALKRVVP